MHVSQRNAAPLDTGSSEPYSGHSAQIRSHLAVMTEEAEHTVVSIVWLCEGKLGRECADANLAALLSTRLAVPRLHPQVKSEQTLQAPLAFYLEPSDISKYNKSGRCVSNVHNWRLL